MCACGIRSNVSITADRVVAGGPIPLRNLNPDECARLVVPRFKRLKSHLQRSRTLRRAAPRWLWHWPAYGFASASGRIRPRHSCRFLHLCVSSRGRSLRNEAFRNDRVFIFPLFSFLPTHHPFLSFLSFSLFFPPFNVKLDTPVIPHALRIGENRASA